MRGKRTFWLCCGAFSSGNPRAAIYCSGWICGGSTQILGISRTTREIRRSAESRDERPRLLQDADLPDEIDIAKAADVDWLMAQADPAIWHEAAIAALAYRGDRHGFVPWLVQQPQMDRATAGWILMASPFREFLTGARASMWATGVAVPELVEILTALCERSDRIGFSNDRLGLEQEWEEPRQACMAIIEGGELDPRLRAPTSIVGKPFPAPQEDMPYSVHDGLMISTQFFKRVLPQLFE